MSALETLDAAVSVGRRTDFRPVASSRAEAVSRSAGGPSQAGHDLLLSVVTAVAGMVAAVVLAPIGGQGALGIGLLALVLLAFAVGRWVRLQQRIQSVATEWQLTLDAMNFPIFTLDVTGRILRMNRAAMLLSGRPYGENLGRPIADLGSGEPWRTAAEQAARAGSDAQTVTVEDGAGGDAWEITVSTAEDPGRVPLKIIAVARNVTEQVARQESLQRRKLMAATGTLVAGVAHDIRNFLFAIDGVVGMFETGIDEREDQRRLLDLLREHGGRMSALMQTLLDYGKPIELSRRPQAIRGVIDEARRICAAAAAEKGVELEVRCESEMPAALLDRTGALQVFKNLLENAIQYSPRGGRVRVETCLAGAWIECRVVDSGPGFGEADLGRIFEPYYSRRRGGTGLGLAIARRVVNEHGGEIEAVDHPRGGAELRVRFPVAAIAAA